MLHKRDNAGCKTLHFIYDLKAEIVYDDLSIKSEEKSVICFFQTFLYRDLKSSFVENSACNLAQ